MIQIDKGAPPDDLKEAANLAKTWLQEYQTLVSDKKRKAKKEAFFEEKKLKLDSAHYAPDGAKRQLYETHYGKCAYCESRIIHAQYGDVEHVRPKNGVFVRKPDGKQLEVMEGYYFRAFSWENLLLSCGSCNQEYKKNFFPIMPENFNQPDPAEDAYSGSGPIAFQEPSKVFASADHPDIREVAILLDPSKENPRLSLQFDPKTALAGPRGSGDGVDIGRAGSTVHLLGLNRIPLLERRCLHLLMLHTIFLCAMNQQSCLERIYKIGDAYLGDWKLATEWKTLGGTLMFGDPATNQEAAMCRLALAVHPGSEYSAMAADVICEWCAEEVKNRVREMQALAATQSPDQISLPIAASANLRIQMPLSLHQTFKMQSSDYGAVVKAYCESRGFSIDKVEQRRRLYPEMNELIERYKATWLDLRSVFGAGDDRKALLAIKNHVEDIQIMLDRSIEDMDGSDTENARFMHAVGQLQPLFIPVASTGNFLEASGYISKNRGEIDSRMDAFVADRRRWPHQDPRPALYALAAGNVDEIRKALAEQVLTYQDQYWEILDNLTELVVDANGLGVYEKPMQDRHGPLKNAILESISAIDDFLNGKTTSPVKGSKPVTIALMKAK